MRKDDIANNLRKFSLNKPAASISSPKRLEEKVEIIVPCYNHAQHLPQTFESVVCQSWKEHPITLTVVDDNSSDSTWIEIGEFEKHKPGNIKYRKIRNKQNLRQWASINKAVGESDSELFIILNDDDILVEDCLEKIIYAFKTNPNLSLVGGSSIWFEDKLPKHKIKSVKDIDIKIYSPDQAKKYKELNDLNMTHSSQAFLKQAWVEVGGYFSKQNRIHSEANEDRDFQMRVNSIFDVGVYNYPLAYWRTDSSHGKNY